ncbi:MAG TPA: magnesium transporter MgtC [Bacteroidales bacterium]|nr:magnesium transporter MgtC [Bacteroidales bacterium]HCB61360.1 magnesium transporter MgtC [Bacteroidales bacterium]HCY24235.1 magnesium transporter MgtC [Bacteroidales bacterium]
MDNLFLQEMNPQIDTWDVILRLFLSFAAGLIIGIERGRHKQVLSLRPHILIAVGSTLVMLISIYMPQVFGADKNYDPGRIAAQVVSGIGFLGAGAIIRMGVNVKGLTTATTIWVASAIGLAIGAGFYFAALIAVIIILLVLILIDFLEKNVFRESLYKVVTVKYTGVDNRKEDVVAILKRHQVRILTINIEKDFEKQFTKMHFQVQIVMHADSEIMCNQISEVFAPGNLRSVEFETME